MAWSHSLSFVLAAYPKRALFVFAANPHFACTKQDQSVVSCAAAADVVLDVLQLVVGLFQYLEGAQQRQPLFGFTTPATEMVAPFWDVAECRELGNVEPGSLTPSTRLPVSR